jgi:hypothetical protein
VKRRGSLPGLGEALDRRAKPGLQFGTVAEFGPQHAAAGRDAADEIVDRRGSAAGLRVVQPGAAQVAVQRLQRVRVVEGGQRLGRFRAFPGRSVQREQRVLAGPPNRRSTIRGAMTGRAASVARSSTTCSTDGRTRTTGACTNAASTSCRGGLCGRAAPSCA